MFRNARAVTIRRMPSTPDPERRVTAPIGRKPDARPDAGVAALAAEQFGVVSLDELRACGLSEKAVRVRVARGQLHRLHRGVYAVGHPNVPLQGRFLAAVKACGEGAVLSHLCAAVLWGLLDWAEREIDVTVPGAAP
ncbi:MAG TPA: type IV toxin-antitoxin system AbiEi family antitoxin domain-containing protein, partial [Solirubrobacteraceae bacterium]|nr:type IV toxin-antitoxin system AbiEi family antitoxin domain-containing protein [Solirubrobacteraceae bacterium]